MRVAMIGATGLIGRMVAPGIVEAGHQLLLIGRRPAAISGAEELIGPIPEWPSMLAGRQVDVAISTLGTTWRKAQSWEAFAAVDRDAVAAFAESARNAGARQMIGVSSVGADIVARNRYLALKGEAETRLRDVGFDRLDLLRPGLLRGSRGADRRAGERFGILISPLINPLLMGPLHRYRAIDAAVVAAALRALVGAIDAGTYVHRNREIERLAR
jgi:uncharacterized protein YbjT (DUF2867 family)